MSWGFVLCIFVLKYLRVGPLSGRVEQDKDHSTPSLCLSLTASLHPLHPSVTPVSHLSISVILSLFPSWPDPCISSFTPHPTPYILHLPSTPHLSHLLHFSSSLYSPLYIPALVRLVSWGREGAQSWLDWSIKFRAEQSVVSSRQAVKNQNGSALQTRSLAVDFQGGFCASDFCERP